MVAGSLSLNMCVMPASGMAQFARAPMVPTVFVHVSEVKKPPCRCSLPLLLLPELEFESEPDLSPVPELLCPAPELPEGVSARTAGRSAKSSGRVGICKQRAATSGRGLSGAAAP
jgi:hypothetical protein